jgi:two-component sensor histidine kinase
LNDLPLHPDAKLSLMLAVIDSSGSPLLLIDGDLVVVAASASFCDAFGLDPNKVAGQKLTALGAGEWNVPQLASLLDATASGFAKIDAYELELKRPGKPLRCLVINAHKLLYEDKANTRLLVSVLDVTEAREADKQKDNLLREKAILLQELQHRVANSLQIVASVLMQSARRVQSEEARGHLTDAHSRVMSIAALQQQLTTSSLGEVELRSYFTALCKSIGASMISDPEQIKLSVDADTSSTSAEISVSLGLIITELVINALKHAFPGRNRRGAITVSYRATGKAWALSVTDDGVGMPKDEDDRVPGLGTSIVAALARQLEAIVTVGDAKPGTIIHVVGK